MRFILAVLVLNAAVALAYVGHVTPAKLRSRALGMSANEHTYTRRQLATTAAALLTLPLAVFAEEAAVTEAPRPTVKPEDAPTDFGMTRDYASDAAKMVRHMRYATLMDKGNPVMEKVAKLTKEEMTDFVALYRRNGNIAGKVSYSTLYTAINVLAGHYTSYGPKYPVPEKRRKRLLQEYTEVERSVKKGR